jgi:RHS repeat-associated protein
VRRDLQADKREEFDYDGLYRLSQSRRYPTAGGSTPAATDHFTYDNLGNLSNKGGAPGAHTYSNYNYGTRSGCSNTVIRPHAVYQVTVSGTTRRYCYDGNGNVISVSRASGSGPLAYDTTSWWVANLARRISQGSSAGSEFEYGPDRERIRQVAQKSANLSETTLYVGGLYEKLTRVENGTTTTAHVHYIRGGTDTVAIYKKTVNGPVETRYLHRDHLGSVVAATDTAGAVLERYSYDPWGKRRDPGTWQTPAPGTFSHDPVFSDRGYTGHEHLDHVGLVNMNGRVYDPEIGRFLSADPYVQFPESTQGYNRYSYVGNNPLSYTDPSGFLSFRKVLQAAGIILSFVLPGSAAWVQGALLDSMLKGFVAGFLSAGGDLRGGLLGAFGAGLFYGTHLLQARFSLGSFAHSLIKALAGGLLSAAAGGKFGEGFLGAFAGGFLGEKMEFLGGATGSGDFSDMIVRVVRDAVIGGIASELGGGKFRNGAITAAFARLYNDELAARDKLDKEIDEIELSDEEAEKVFGHFYRQSAQPVTREDIEQVGGPALRLAKEMLVVATERDRIVDVLDVLRPNPISGPSKMRLVLNSVRKAFGMAPISRIDTVLSEISGITTRVTAAMYKPQKDELFDSSF